MPQPKQNRPRIDAVINHIKKGSYDEELPKLIQALNERNEVRKEYVLSLVHEVYGGDHIVAGPTQLSRDLRSTVAKNPETFPQPQIEGEILPGQSPHVLDPNSPEGIAAMSGSGQDPEDSPDFESRSPIIQGIE